MKTSKYGVVISVALALVLAATLVMARTAAGRSAESSIDDKQATGGSTEAHKALLHAIAWGSARKHGNGTLTNSDRHYAV